MPDSVAVAPVYGPSDVWSINVSGLERHDGEKPYTYVLEAHSVRDAKNHAWLYHLWSEVSEDGTVAPDGTVPGCPDGVNRRLASSHRSDDLVVIDCAEFPCDRGRPFECSDPVHFDKHVTERTDCRCDWYWTWVTRFDVASIDIARLRELGYALPPVAPEEHTW